MWKFCTAVWRIYRISRRVAVMCFYSEVFPPIKYYDSIHFPQLFTFQPIIPYFSWLASQLENDDVSLNTVKPKVRTVTLLRCAATRLQLVGHAWLIYVLDTAKPWKNFYLIRLSYFTCHGQTTWQPPLNATGTGIQRIAVLFCKFCTIS